MNTRFLVGLAGAVAVVAASSGVMHGQSRSTRPARVVASVPERPDRPQAIVERDSQDFDFRYRGPILRFGQDFTLKAGEQLHELVAIEGTVTLDGRAHDDVVIIAGTVKLGSTAVLERGLVVVGGDATIQPGAVIRGDLVIVGGTLDAPPGFSPEGGHVVVGTPVLGQWVRDIVPWVSHGLLWGRLIVPGLPWMWALLGTMFLISLAINHVFDRPVRAAAEAVVNRPLSAFLTGTLVLILSLPVFIILAVSVIGLIVMPFVAIIAWTVGKVGVTRGLGMSILAQSEPESRLQSARSFTLGFVVIAMAYAVPVLGLFVWTLVSVLGLGAAVVAFVATIRREYPRKPPVQAVAVQPPPAGPPTPPPAAPPDASRPSGPADSSGPSWDAAGWAPPADPAPAARPFDQGGTASATVPPAPREGLLGLPRAGFLDRIAAFTLDCLLVAIVENLLSLWIYGSPFFPLLLVYHIAFWTWKSTTLGGIICGLRLVRTTGEPLRVVEAIVRGLSSVFSIVVLGIGCFWMIQDPEKQMWHDKIAGTVVVKVPRDWPL